MTGGEAKRTRRLSLLGVLLLVAAIAITAGRVIHSRMQQARLTQDRPKDLQYGVPVYSPATADKAQEVKAKYLAKANLLRDHWRVWAVKHQDLLRLLQQAPPNDYQTLMRVYSALPYRLNKSTGVMQEDVAFDVDASVVQFTWQPHKMPVLVSQEMLKADPRAQATSDKYEKAFLEKLQTDFTNYHGIMLSESAAAGSSRITLWADGRITEMVLQDQHIIGKPSYVDGLEKELVPAYDFLR